MKKKNRPIKDEILNSLSGESSNTRLMTKNYSDYQIVLENTYKNTSKKPIKEYFTILEILNEKGDVLISLNCNYDWSKKYLKPNELITNTLIFEINKYENTELIVALNTSQSNPNYIDKKLVFR